MKPRLPLARRPHASHLPALAALAAAAVACWYPFAPGLSLAAAAVAAILGGVLGAACGGGRLRTPVVLIGGIASSALLAALARAAGRTGPGPLSPELAAALLDTLLVASLTGGGALCVMFLAHRVDSVRPLAVSLVVLSAALLLAVHRGGAIHRPLHLSDRAFVNGLHPSFVLAAAGALAGLVAALALVRWRRARWRTLQVLALAALAVTTLSVAPGLGLFSFPTVDPLGLSSDDTTDYERIGGEGGDASEGSRHEAGDALGLAGTEGGNEPIAPFRDEYSREGSEAPVAIVTLHDDVDPLGGVFYFRQVAFSRFNGRRLVRALDGKADADLFPRFPGARPLTRTVFGNAEARFEVPTTTSLMREHAQPPVLTDGSRIESRPVADATMFRHAYAARSSVLYGDPSRLLGRSSVMDHLPDDVRERYLEHPLDPRYDAIAQEALARIGESFRDDPWARAIAVALWLEENTSYSLRSRHASAADPTGSFLFGDRIGYCVHLAHAAAYLARALGVPSRVAAGYAYRAADRAGGSALLLRAGDAHAWAEIWIDGIGWVPVDPSPPSLDPPLESPDLDLQRLLGELARPQQDRLVANAPGAYRQFPWRTALLGATLLLLAAWAALGHAVKTWRRLAPRLFRDGHARLAYRAALDRLAEAGLARRVGETREAFAARASMIAPSFGTLTREHLAASFGTHNTPSGRARSLAASASREVAAGGGLRRWLGVLAPWRWTRSR